MSKKCPAIPVHGSCERDTLCLCGTHRTQITINLLKNHSRNLIRDKIMKEIQLHELETVQGGTSIGTILGTLAFGFITAGPAGLGMAASTLIITVGIDNLNDMRKNNEFKHIIMPFHKPE